MDHTVQQVEGLALTLYDSKLDRIVHENLDGHELQTITHCLRIAAERFHEDCDNMAEVAKQLRAGTEPTAGLWAPGEAGAKAADRMAEQFHQYEGDARKLLAKLDGEDTDDEEGSGK